MESIKELLRKNCERLLDKKTSGKTLREVARLTGVSETTIHRWKTGENSPELSNIKELAKALEIPEIEFFVSHPVELKPVPMSTIANRIGSVPDKIYEIAEKLGADHKAWKDAQAVLEVAVEAIEKKAKKA